ncbi:MAG: cupin domain-containing protein [Burkholderiales bacterium]|nr:cupin domain-containing protein [Burkholderiales bacterium]
MATRRTVRRKSRSPAARGRAADAPSSRRKTKAHTKTKTRGAVRGGAGGRYHYDMAGLKVTDAGKGYSTSHGGVVEGARMLVGYIHKPRGTGSRMHTHGNEQLNYVLRGTLVGSVNGRKVVAPKGTLIYIPANAPHTLVASPDDEDVIFLAIKDLSQGIIGMAVDGTMSGPLYLEGYGPAR